jgi:NTE family protein
LVSVDVADGLPVTFDNYAKEEGSRKTEYGRYINKQDSKEIGFERVIRYDNGITLDQVMASGCYPVNFDYESLEVESYYDPINNNNNPDSFLSSSSKNSSNRNSSRAGASSPPDRVFRKHYIKETRYFWDGGMMSNTLVTQLIQLHRNYWYKARGLKDKVPALGVCVINVHQTRQKEIPTDHDGVVNRNNDIIFSDRSHKEEEVLLLISDYVDLVRDLIRIARDNGVKEKSN